MVHVLFATMNPGKLRDAENAARQFSDIKLCSPAQLGVTEDVVEVGATYAENARLKRDHYIRLLAELGGFDDYYVVGDDSGIEIQALDGEPGIHSRRWKDGATAMTDQEIVDYCLEKMKDVPAGKRGADFVGMMTFGRVKGGFAKDVEYRLRGELVDKGSMSAENAGFPFRELFYMPEYGMLLHEIVALPVSERPPGFVGSHREKGFRQAFSAILQDAHGYR